MPNSISLLGTQLKEIWKHFGINQKASVIIGLVVLLVALGVLLYWSTRTEYQLLYSGMSLKDAAAVREKLDDEKIPYQLKESGRALFVPGQDVYRARLLLAAEGLPKDSTTGFELFEQPKFGLTDFAQQVNYQRALQGELERTIQTMSGIEKARVLLVLPKEKLFATQEEKKASASILLTVTRGVALAPSQVLSIAQLVSGSVPGLDPNNITITDQMGQLLSRRAGSEDDEASQASDQISAQEKVESLLTKKAQEMLDRALGPGRSIVRVSAQMDFSKIERRNETYDAEGRVVRSESISTEQSSAPAPMGGGVAGVVANIPVGSPTSGTIEKELSKSKKENIRTEYAIPNGVEMITQRGGRIAKLSVSVCVAKGQEARSAEELKNVEDMVKGAVGFSNVPTRQDAIEVTEMEFADVTPLDLRPWWDKLPIRMDALGRGALAALLVFVIYRLSRRVIASLVVQREEAGVPIKTLTEEYEGGAAGEEVALGPQTDLERIKALAEQNPKALAAWITSVIKPD